MLNEERDRWQPINTGHGPTDELKMDPRLAATLTGKQWKNLFTELKREFTIIYGKFNRSVQNDPDCFPDFCGGHVKWYYVYRTRSSGRATFPTACSARWHTAGSRPST